MAGPPNAGRRDRFRNDPPGRLLGVGQTTFLHQQERGLQALVIIVAQRDEAERVAMSVPALRAQDFHQPAHRTTCRGELASAMLISPSDPGNSARPPVMDSLRNTADTMRPSMLNRIVSAFGTCTRGARFLICDWGK